ncbi:MAG: type II toxin-antitoxin system VapC family toxin [Alphaproteobacteria bacterium]|nr:type II toxin-antitoxin system VapC family toxin [Alphaproteobacteria bacterium]
MILLDANILLYAHIRDFPQHERVRAWLDERLSGEDRVGIPWASILAFLRICTNRRIFPRAHSIAAAWEQMGEWLALPQVWIPLPTGRHGEILRDVLLESGAEGELVPDADLAALAIEHGLTVCSTDGDFARFPMVRWIDPLKPRQ